MRLPCRRSGRNSSETDDVIATPSKSEPPVSYVCWQAEPWPGFCAFLAGFRTAVFTAKGVHAVATDHNLGTGNEKPDGDSLQRGVKSHEYQP